MRYPFLKNDIKKQVVVTYTSLSISWLLLMIAIFSFILSGCRRDTIVGSGHVITEERPIDPFSEVTVDGSFDIQLTQDGNQPLKIEAEDNVMRVVETYVSGNTLRIKIKDHTNLRRYKTIQVYVHSAAFNRVIFSGSGSLNTTDTIRASKFTYELNGSASANLTLNADQIATIINGSGNMRFKGKANSYNSEINGSGDINGLDLLTHNASLTVHGSGDQSISVDTQLDVNIYGSGNVQYKGNPGKVNSNVQGSGKVIKR
ncbi:head GIN domain-containing protein [Chitinophaga defluvii]|uniref:Head GIN domain-containing protein n=1 Tax=Chitinophaga defluvii TaxID=3163343 RepID=A0ABV2T6J3_9BACT